jgi:hypothetical protein
MQITMALNCILEMSWEGLPMLAFGESLSPADFRSLGLHEQNVGADFIWEKQPREYDRAAS